MGNGPCGVVPDTEVATYGPQYRFNVPWELLKRAVEKFGPLGWSVVFFGIWDFGMEISYPGFFVRDSFINHVV